MSVFEFGNNLCISVSTEEKCEKTTMFACFIVCLVCVMCVNFCIPMLSNRSFVILASVCAFDFFVVLYNSCSLKFSVVCMVVSE